MKIRREVRIGFVILVGLALLFWGLNFLKGRNIFAEERTFFAVYDEVSGLEIASPVVIHGFKIGQVEKISFMPDDPGARLLVEILIKNEIEIPVNSYAHIFSSDIVGSKAIEIRRGDSTQLMVPGDTFRTSIAASLQEEVSVQMLPLKLKAEGLIQSFDSVLAVIQYVFNEGTRDNLAKTFESVKLTIQNLESTSYNIDVLVEGQRNRLAQIVDNVNSISTNIRENNDKLNNVITNFSTISDTIAALDFARTIYLTNNSLAELNSAVSRVNAGEGTLGLLITNDSLYMNIERSANELDLLLEDMRINPQRYIHFSVFGRGPRQNRYYAPVEIPEK